MNESLSILLIEDDQIDIKTVQRAFTKNHLANKLFVCCNGKEALDFLTHQGAYVGATDEEAPRPGLILLDLNMPIMNGLEFLEQVKSDPELKAIPVIPLTTSKEDQDRIKAYEMGAAGYIRKPVHFQDFVNIIKQFQLYWQLCELPPE